MNVLLISTYELGRQPVHVASPAAALKSAGHEVRALDLSVEALDESVVAWADVVAISTPMHTATRVAVDLARAIRASRPELPIASYGLYASAAIDENGAMPFDRAIVGEYERALVEWVAAPAAGEPVTLHLTRGGFETPDRAALPSLDKYAQLSVDDELRLVGAVEASHGCLHRCKHCPIPAFYDGTFRVVNVDAVIADIDQLVAQGATHITFGDPDFLNGPAHSLRILDEMHRMHPSLTFDCTVKVEHILRHRDMWAQMAEYGCLFVVSAFESMSDRVLALLDKGHTAADSAAAVHVIRDAGIDIRPSWLPFTPWTTRADVDAMFRFISAHDLIESTDPVQMGIRLLIPRGSLVMGIEGVDAFVGGYDADGLTYTWTSSDPELDSLSHELLAIADQGAQRQEPIAEVFLKQWVAVVRDSSLEPPVLGIDAGSTEGRPKLTESWFC